ELVQRRGGFGHVQRLAGFDSDVGTAGGAAGGIGAESALAHGAAVRDFRAALRKCAERFLAVSDCFLRPAPSGAGLFYGADDDWPGGRCHWPVIRLVHMDRYKIEGGRRIGRSPASPITLVILAILLLIGARSMASYAIDVEWWKELGQFRTWLNMLYYGLTPL